MRPMDLYHEKTMLRPLESKPLYLVLAWLRESRPAAYYMLIETARAGIDGVDDATFDALDSVLCWHNIQTAAELDAQQLIQKYTPMWED